MGIMLNTDNETPIYGRAIRQRIRPHPNSMTSAPKSLDEKTNRDQVMSASYPIIKVKPEWIVNPEDMGTKEKSWFRFPLNGCLHQRDNSP